MATRTPIEIEQQIIEDYINNFSIKDITRKYIKDDTTIYAILRRHQIKRTRAIKDNTTRFLDGINNYLYPENECWTWLGRIDQDGYGVMHLDGKSNRAHRISYMVHKAYEPKKHEVVMHICDNPSCVNPFHLEIGTPQDNNADKQNKNRQAKGSKIASSKLTEEEVKFIKYSSIDNQTLAEKYNVTMQCIWMIKKGINWRHV